MRVPIFILIILMLSMTAKAQRRIATAWSHPSGLISRRMVVEMREKCSQYPWARQARDGVLASVKPWIEIPLEKLRALTPRKRSNVYHNFTCPRDHSMLTFDPFNDAGFKCPVCKTVYPPDGIPGVYAPGSAYAGTYHDGWACLYLRSISDVTFRLGLAYALTQREDYAKRALAILSLFAEITPSMPRQTVGGWPVIFTYATEGEAMLLEFTLGYELARSSPLFTEELRHKIEHDFLKSYCDDVFRKKEYTVDWNNVYYWQLINLQMGATLEDPDYIDFAVGQGKYAPDKLPQHRSYLYLAQHGFKPDGGFYELCSGYHLYPLTPMLRAVVSLHEMSRQDPDRFPPNEFEALAPEHPVGKVARRALHWYLALTLPDYTMSQLGDSMNYRDSLMYYNPSAEIAYRYFGMKEVACYPEMYGARGVWGLVYGEGNVRRRKLPCKSTRLSSGFVALRQEQEGNQVYAGLNALQPGDPHQHADRLELITYSHDRLLGLEKATPYNNLAVLNAGKASNSHNTVSVDMSSQRPGNELQGDQIPRVRYFQSTPGVQFAEVWGDRIYPQTTRYRRVVLLVEDVIVDIFDVVGGQVHDWLYHGDGDKLDFDLPMQPMEHFEPAAYLVGGDPRCEKAVATEAWSATWELEPERALSGQPLHLGPIKWTPHDTGDFYPERKQTVFHRLTMLPSPGTEVYHLRTYPVQKKPTGNEGFTHTVLARRRNTATPFVSLFDTYLKQPRVRQGELLSAKPEGSVAVSFATDTSRTVVMYNPEPDRTMELVGDGMHVEMHGHLAVVCFALDGKPKNVLLCGVSRLQLPGLAFELEAPANLSLTLQANGRWTATARADLEYESLDGKPVYASAGDVDLWLRTPTSNLKIRARGRR